MGFSLAFTRNASACKPRCVYVLAWVAVFVCLVIAVIAGRPVCAWADTYTVDGTNIHAQVQTDGSLHVIEQRIYNFKEPSDEIIMAIPYFGSSSEVSFASARLAAVDEAGNVAGDWLSLQNTPFSLSWREEGGPEGSAWSLDKVRNQAYFFFPESEGSVLLELDYTASNALQAYDDIADLNWRYVAQWREEDFENISVILELPVPVDVVVEPGKNVHAWGHGPAEGIVNVNADGTVECWDPLVRSTQYAEVRVVFPVSWLSNLPLKARLAHQGQTQLTSIVKSESTWVDQGNNAYAIGYVMKLALAVFCLALLVIAALVYLRFGREHTPDFTGYVYQDVPDKHLSAAVIGRLWRWNRESTDDVAATLLELIDRGVLLVHEGVYEDAHGKPMRDFCLTCTPELMAACTGDGRDFDPNDAQEGEPTEAERAFAHEIATSDTEDETLQGIALGELDYAALRFVFDEVGEGRTSVWLAEIRTYATHQPDECVRNMRLWQSMLSAQVEKEALFDQASLKIQKMLLVVASICAVCGVLSLILSGIAFGGIALVATGAMVGVIANYVPRRSEHGNNIEARAKALAHWLEEQILHADEKQDFVVDPRGFNAYRLVLGVEPYPSDQELHQKKEFNLSMIQTLAISLRIGYAHAQRLVSSENVRKSTRSHK